MTKSTNFINNLLYYTSFIMNLKSKLYLLNCNETTLHRVLNLVIL